jgi:uncharacterized protein
VTSTITGPSAQIDSSAPALRRRPHQYVKYSAPARSKAEPTAVDPIRVHFNRAWLASGVAGGLIGLAAIRRFGLPALGHMVLGEPTRPQLERVDLWFPQLPPQLDGLRIAQVSDIHLGMLHTHRNLRWAVEQIARERPDLIVLTGDQVMEKHAIPDLTGLLRTLRAPLGVYAISGNHDHWEGLRDVKNALELAGIPLLLNEHRRIEWRGATLWLVGVDDIWDGELDFERALEGVPADGFKLLLGHVPDMAPEAAAHGFDLQLAGHVHGGHLQLPLLGPFVRPRFGVRYLAGLYRVGGMTMYVSRGLGGAPLRLLCPPELTMLTLRRGAST